MRTTAIFSYKGGTGKTTTAINLAAELAARGKRVIVIDADGQRNTSDFFEADKDGVATLYGLLTGTGGSLDSPMSYVEPTGRTGLMVVASSENLATVELDKSLDGSAGIRLTAIRDFCEAIAEDDEADYVLIDCPPSFAPQTVAALIAADDVIVPVTPDSWAVSGLRDVTVSLNGARRSNHRLRIAGVLLTRMNASATARDTEKALRESGVPVFETAIHASTYAPRSSFERRPLRECAHWTGIAQDYKALAEEYMEGGAGNG